MRPRRARLGVTSIFRESVDAPAATASCSTPKKAGDLDGLARRRIAGARFPGSAPAGALRRAARASPPRSGREPASGARRARDYLAIYDDPRPGNGAQPDFAALAGLDHAVIVSAPAPFMSVIGNEEVDFVSRFFAPALGVAEDPVTGSARCTLIPYWAGLTLAQDPASCPPIVAPRQRPAVARCRGESGCPDPPAAPSSFSTGTIDI